MPELAEVEFNRRQWDAGLGARVHTVELHAQSRVCRYLMPSQLRQHLKRARLVSSEAFGKRILFRFSGGGWLGVHLGMTGRLRVEDAKFRAGKHDHLVLRQRGRTLVFTDPRQFGRLDFHQGLPAPAWWRDLPPALNSAGFTVTRMRSFLKRHGRLSVKAALLLQEGFPGVGNWMADEILWQAHLRPGVLAGKLSLEQSQRLWRAVRHVCARALRTIGVNYAEPPAQWLFHQRWTRAGKCPRDGAALRFDVHGGRTTAWCPQCQWGG